MQCLERLIERDRSRDTRRAIGWATKALAVDPWRESVVRTAIELHGIAGDTAAARHLFDTYAQRLDVEYGEQPDAETRAALYRLVEARRTPRERMLPQPAAELIGRERELAAIAERLDEQRLLTIVGHGGIGKTRLALAAALLLGARFADGAVFCDLLAVSDPALVPSSLAGAFGIARSGSAEAIAAICSGYGDRLLIVDNCEHVLEATAVAIGAILDAVPDARILATSREPLHLRDEDVLRLEPLRGDAAISLFTTRAKAVSSRFRESPAILSAVNALCERLDGNALAIELAAARSNVLSVERIVRQLDARFDLLVDGKRYGTSHQRALRTSLDWSYDLLDAQERDVFTRAGVFAGAFTIDAARALCGGSELELAERLSALVDKSLLTVHTDEQGEVRFRMLESMRMYARDRLDGSGAGDAMRSRHLDVIMKAFIDVREHFSATPREALVLELAPLLDDARVALEWALHSDDDDFERGVTLLCATKLWDRLGLSPEALASAQAFLARVGPARPDLASELWRLAAYAGDRSKWNGSLDAGDRAIECARLSGNGDQLSAALAQRAFVASRFGKFAEAAADLDEAEAVAPVTAARRLLIIAARGFLASLEGRLDDAARAQSEILDTNRFLGNEAGVTHGTGNLAEIEHMRGNTDLSIALAEDHIATLGEAAVHSTLRLNLIGYYLARDNIAGAKALAQAELAHYSRDEAGGMHETIVLGYIALIAASAGESRYAAQLNAYVDERYRSGGMVREHTERVVSNKLEVLLDASLERGDRERAAAEGRAWPRERAVFEGERLVSIRT